MKYKQKNKELIATVGKQNRQINWLIKQLADCLSKRYGGRVPISALEHTIHTELVGVE